MALIVRTFRASQGREVEGIGSLKALASGMVRADGGGLVLLCRQINDPAQFLWIGDSGSEVDFECLARPAPTRSSAKSLWESSSTLTLEFLDEFYHFPPRPYQIWALEVHAPPERQRQALKDLFELARVARRDPRVTGVSLYRASETPGVFVGFLALGWGTTPASILRNGLVQPATTERIEREILWRPLSLLCEFKRLPAGNGRAVEAEATRGLPFWGRGNSNANGCPAVSARGEAPIRL